MTLIEVEEVGVLEQDEIHEFAKYFGRQHFVVGADLRLFYFDFVIQQQVASAQRYLIEGYY